MKIAIDLRAMDGASRYRGIGIYIVFLLNSLLPKLLKRHEVWLYVYDPKNLSDIDSDLRRSCKIIKANPSRIYKSPGYIQRLFRGILPREYNRKDALPHVSEVDIFFQPSHEFGVPKTVRKKSIMAAYDLIPLLYEKEYFKQLQPSPNPKTLLAYARKRLQGHYYKESLEQFKHAEHIIAISENTKKDIQEHLKLSAEISVVHLGPTKPLHGSVRKVIRTTANEKPYVIYVGGIDPRRPIDRFVLKSGDLFINQGIRTIVAGRDFENISNQTLRLVVEGGIKSGAITVFGHINEAEKHLLIKNALAFIYPTYYEGFGLPLLEAFTNKTPMITLRSPSVYEVAGSAAIYAKELDDIPKLVKKLQREGDYRDRYVGRGIQQAKQFSWEKCAKETLQIIESMK